MAAVVRELGAWHLEIVKRSEPKGTRSGHTAKGFENLARMGLAFLRLAMIRLMLRRIARHRRS